MVFSSVPPYLDHHNWHHQLHQSNHGGGVGAGVGHENPNLPPPPPPPHPQSGTGGGTEGGGEPAIRPGSMVDRARLAKIPLPEPGLNCPRCDSTNTKFCYFNNYNLTQPRHFCKTCRRYWTRGGALRNVPVGGGCRRNKRNSKSRSSKSPRRSGPKSVSVSPPRSSSDNMTSTQLSRPPSLHLPFMSSLNQYGGFGANLSSNIAGFQPQNEHNLGNFQIANGNNFSNILSIGGGENWRLPFLPGSFDHQVPNNTNLFNYQSEGVEAQSSSMVGLENKSCGIDNPQSDRDTSVKLEGTNPGLNLSRQFLGMFGNTNQQQQQQPWTGNGNSWAEFPIIKERFS